MERDPDFVAAKASLEKEKRFKMKEMDETYKEFSDVMINEFLNIAETMAQFLHKYLKFPTKELALKALKNLFIKHSFYELLINDFTLIIIIRLDWHYSIKNR
ncbi:hypothetical protein F8M41_021331 [Gigaspora margarita]|uniref:Uncharacterized protein n=1 Tax=Gigaspora margarita TaxID=4874 RepID=A0A8H4ETQ6_GIGMA|nr:hypothetical protein F8M41_021331 [Gigaspora margarita]